MNDARLLGHRPLHRINQVALSNPLRLNKGECRTFDSARSRHPPLKPIGCLHIHQTSTLRASDMAAHLRVELDHKRSDLKMAARQVLCPRNPLFHRTTSGVVNSLISHLRLPTMKTLVPKLCSRCSVGGKARDVFRNSTSQKAHSFGRWMSLFARITLCRDL